MKRPTDINLYNIAEAKEALKNGIRCDLAKDENGNYITPPFYQLPHELLGPPGVGKTQIVEQIAKELGIGYLSYSLIHHTRYTVIGLPSIEERTDGEVGGKYTSYTMSEILAGVYNEVDKGHKEGILLLDEFPCMPDTIMPVMLAFLQSKNIGTYSLPEGWVIVLCGNPPEYNKHSRTFDAAITDRIRLIEVDWNPTVFINYAKANHFQSQIIRFLELHPDYAYRITEDELVTCRGWENLSREITVCEKLGIGVDYKMIHQDIKSTTVATAFYNYYVENLSINKSDVTDILEGKNQESLLKKYNAGESVVRLNLLQLLQKYLVAETDSPFTKITRLDQLKQLFDAIKKKGKICMEGSYMTPLETLYYLLENNGDTSELQFGSYVPLGAGPIGGGFSRGGNPRPTPFGFPSPNPLDLPEDFWADKTMILELEELVRTMCDESELTSHQNPTLDDLEKINERQNDRIKNFLQAKRGELKKDWNRLCREIDNTFLFLEKLTGGASYAERLYYFIGHNPNLQRTVAEGTSKEYLKKLETIYGDQPA